MKWSPEIIRRRPNRERGIAQTASQTRDREDYPKLLIGLPGETSGHLSAVVRSDFSTNAGVDQLHV